jgi:acyl carrier protein
MQVSPSSIDDRSGPETIATWDSFNALILLDEIEAFYNVKFALDEIDDFKTVADIKKHLRNHGVKVENTHI